ncbi:MAG: DUF357 domain-containing protein [Bdellovibrio sp.]|nr:MAG: DUF357 domain-containing protein [Bdellovibrio sp.]
MEHAERARKSLEKTIAFFEENERLLSPKIRKKALQYIKDSSYFLEMGDFFTSFGASDYAYGLIEGNLECKK